MTQNRKVSKKNPKLLKYRRWFWSTWILVFFATFVVVFQYRYDIKRYYYFQRSKLDTEWSQHKKTSQDLRNRKILSAHFDKVLGIDISHYQQTVDWEKSKWMYDEYPISFVIVRATMGGSGKDITYNKNWKYLKSSLFVRGAYHYYRPDEPSVEQAQNFIQTVQLHPGDLPPILDIENLPRIQSMDRLKEGLRNWLNIVEKHYGVKPIIYSGQHYYENYLFPEFNEYKIWIANYNHWVQEPKDHWSFWQFTEKGKVNGIETLVDLNIFNGNSDEFSLLRIRSVR